MRLAHGPEQFAVCRHVAGKRRGFKFVLGDDSRVGSRWLPQRALFDDCRQGVIQGESVKRDLQRRSVNQTGLGIKIVAVRAASIFNLPPSTARSIA